MAVNLIATEIVNKWRKHNCLCGLCGVPVSREDSGLCKPCAADLPKNDRACPGCAVPMPAPLLCPECLQHPNHDITSIFTLYRYEYPINRLIQAMKYQARTDIACSMGNQLGLAALGQGLPIPDCIIPVPLHRSRVAERGYNQALEIARPLANMLGIPIDLKTCKRNRRTLPQTGLPAQQRRHNIRGAFTITRTPNYGHVAIIDDVVTTRATVNELSRHLMRAGVNRIDVWACARAFF
ncbi:MAG: competence protein [Gammaproteobacteria bacterium]|nr:competence protein [Gammaproteobacteria bacterium]